jgi:hypothetical protein
LVKPGKTGYTVYMVTKGTKYEDDLYDAIERAREIENRPSFSNMVKHAVYEYIREHHPSLVHHENSSRNTTQTDTSSDTD